MNSTKKNGLITFGIIVVVINALMILYFALRYNDIQVGLPETILTPTSFSEPVSLPE